MILTFIICGIAALFAMSILPIGEEKRSRNDLFFIWLAFFVSCCIVVIPLRWFIICLFF